MHLPPQGSSIDRTAQQPGDTNTTFNALFSHMRSHGFNWRMVYILWCRTLKSCEHLKMVPSKRFLTLWNLVFTRRVEINLCHRCEHIRPGNHLLLALNAFFIDKLDFGSLPSESLASQVGQAAQSERQKPGPQPNDSQKWNSTPNRVGLPWAAFGKCGSLSTQSRHIEIGWDVAPQP